MSKKQLRLALNITLSRDTIITSLNELGYERVSMVIEPGTFSVKGSIVDVFPINQNQPLRCDFFSGSIDRLTSFRIDTQRSIRDIIKTTIGSCHEAVFKRVSFETQQFNSTVISNIHDGDYIVHERYGIGVFSGFCRLTVANIEGEYVFIQFKGKDKLYMPLDQIPLIHRYAGSNATPRLNGLYDGQWEKIRRKTNLALQHLASDIYDMFKKRSRGIGYKFSSDTEDQLVFESAFKHKETSDQIKVISEIKRDMESNRPMDRLLCGDVGFGKTEVMIRAAVKASLDLKQVMVLVPTTILAEQHYKTFIDRCHALDIHIDIMSRLKTTTHNKRVINRLKTHKTDIVIGTHRLLQEDIQFTDLGLVIVDEEQRFGVTHKEKIKKMTANIDILSTSATPIPRTLYLSLTGAKSISTLTTSPPGRHPIHTVIGEYSLPLIKKAIEFEVKRGGQVYFLHNNIQQLHSIADTIKKILPKLNIGVVHGQMLANELDEAMVNFYQKKCDVLCCTSIIENGLDINTANTIIINRSDRLGLSQIHQIRGRVGRRDIQAYAYILFPKSQQLTSDAKDRLQAIKEAVGLGVGYQLAMKDLEIRGAGTLLGEKQSGHLTAIGFDLYCKLLDQFIRKARGQKVQDALLLSLSDAPNVFIPATYIENDQERMAMYQRFLSIKSTIQLKQIQIECNDRFGVFPKKMEEFIKAIERKVFF